MEILGLCGFAGAGKSTVAGHLAYHHGFIRFSFAKAVKDITASAFGWQRERLEGVTPADREWREVPDVFWSERLGRPFSPRTALQYIGTDVFRNHVHPDIWVDSVVAQFRNLPPDARVVIDDVRFVNERTILRSLGATFMIIERTDRPTSNEHQRIWNMAMNNQGQFIQSELHPSEWNWLTDPRLNTDTVIRNSGSIDKLNDAIDHWYCNPAV